MRDIRKEERKEEKKEGRQSGRLPCTIVPKSFRRILLSALLVGEKKIKTL